MQTQLEFFAVWAVAGYRRAAGKDAQRGDVPGWVMVTIMTAGLVVVIFGVFRTQITTAISNAMDSVTNGTKGN
jgi:Na+/H+ antiporter NhaD/arsenite permease-like protein